MEFDPLDRLIHAYVRGKDLILVLAVKGGIERKIVHLPLQLYFETAKILPEKSVNPMAQEYYYFGAQCLTKRTWVSSNKEWRNAAEEIRQDHSNNLTSAMLYLKPEIAYMVQNKIKVGDFYTPNHLDGRAFRGESDGVKADSMPPLRGLVFDIETTTLDPTEPGAHVITIAAISEIIYTDRVEYVEMWIGQIGNVNTRHPSIQKHRDRHPGVPLYVIPFICDGLDLREEVRNEGMHAKINSCESRLLSWWDHLMRSQNPDIVIVSVSFFFHIR